MKRSLYGLVSIAVAAGFAGATWAEIRSHNRYETAAENARVARIAELKKPAAYFGELVRDADVVVIAQSGLQNEKSPTARITETAWRNRFAAALEGALYRKTSHALWLSDQSIDVYRNDRAVFDLMLLPGTVIVSSEKFSGDYYVGDETIRALADLVREEFPPHASSAAAAK